MNKEKQKQDYERKKLIEELSKMPPMVLATAYLHGLNYTLYGEDVTEKWLTAVQQTSILEKAYRKGYYDAMQRLAESEHPVVDESKLALLEKTYADFCRCEGGEGWLKIDGKEYSTDAGYALEGMRIFMEVFRQRLAESEKE